MKRYDTTFIIDGQLKEEDREAIISNFEESLKKLGAEVEHIVRWGMRHLAYEIKKRTQGYYAIFYYTIEPANIKSFHRDLRINEHILRYMTIHFDGNHPDYIKEEFPTTFQSDITESVFTDEETDKTIEEPLLYADEKESEDYDVEESLTNEELQFKSPEDIDSEEKVNENTEKVSDEENVEKKEDE